MTSADDGNQKPRARGPKPPGRRPPLPKRKPNSLRPPAKAARRPAGGGPPRRKPTPRRPARKKAPSGKPWFKLFTLLVFLVLGGAIGYLYYRGQASLPQIEGSAGLPGLSAPVEVLRDDKGIPHLFASSIEDLSRAAGYVHSQDRLFQMELLRRLGTGRMAEIFGSSSSSAPSGLEAI